MKPILKLEFIAGYEYGYMRWVYSIQESTTSRKLLAPSKQISKAEAKEMVAKYNMKPCTRNSDVKGLVRGFSTEF